MDTRHSTIPGACRHWLRLFLCTFLLMQGGLVAAESDDCSARAFAAVGHSEATLDRDASPAALEGETAESLEDIFSSLVSLSAESFGRHGQGLRCGLPDFLDRADLRTGHLTRAPPLL